MSDRSRLTLSLPQADWTFLETQAREAGVKIGTHAQNVLKQHVADARAAADELPPEPDPVPTKSQWQALNQWLAADFTRGDAFQSSGFPRKRSGMLAWARTQGFTE